MNCTDHGYKLHWPRLWMALTTVMNDTDHGYETRYMRYHFLPLRGRESGGGDTFENS